MRRVLTAVVAVTLLVLPGAFSPAQAATPMNCAVDPGADVTSYVNNVEQAEPVAAPKADLRRFCAGASATRLVFRFRVPAVDPTTDAGWGGNTAYVYAGVDTGDISENPEFLVGVLGPFTEGRFTVLVVQHVGDSQYQTVECGNVASSYDAVNKVIRASAPASCVGSPASFNAQGFSYRDPNPATPNSYLIDSSSVFAFPGAA